MIETGSFWKVDPHAHTNRSDGRIKPLDLAQLAARAGLDGYGETDHDVWARQEEESHDELIARLRGIEVTTGTGHLLVYAPLGINNRKIPMAYSLAETVRRAEGEGYKVVVPHLNLGPVPGSASTSAVRRLYDAGLSVDGIETAHTFFSDRHRKDAAEIAAEFNIAQVGSGDDHTGNIGRRFYTLIPRMTEDPIADFYTALENRTTVPVKSGLDLLPTSGSKNAIRHVRAFFVGLPAKVIASPRFLETAVAYYAGELFRR